MSDAELVEYFADLRHEVDLAAQRYAEVVAERDQLREALALVYFHLGPPQPPLHGDHLEVPALVEKAMAERDRLRADRDDWRNVADDFSAELADTKAERDRLRLLADAVLALWSDLTDVDEDGAHKQFPATRYAPVDDALDALGLLDGNEAINE